jgi:hypothetical protein
MPSTRAWRRVSGGPRQTGAQSSSWPGRTSAATLRRPGARRRPAGSGPSSEERGLRASSTSSRSGPPPSGGPEHGAAEASATEPDAAARHGRRSVMLVDRDGPGCARRAARPAGRCRRRRHARPHGAPVGRGRGGLAERGGSLRRRPAPAGPDRRSLAAIALMAGLRDAPIPILAGGHTLVGPGIRLLAARARAPSSRCDVREHRGRGRHPRGDRDAVGRSPFARFMALALGHPDRRLLHGAAGAPDARTATS